MEQLPNQRYHLYLYSRNLDLQQQLKEASKPTSDPNYMSLEMNKTNNLFIVPPYCDSVYRVQNLHPQHELYEKVIEFNTGCINTMIDILNMIDVKKYRINYIVCNREKTFIAFRDGIDAIEGVNILRRYEISASFAKCYAHIDHEGNNECHPYVVRGRSLHTQKSSSIHAVEFPINDARNTVSSNHLIHNRIHKRIPNRIHKRIHNRIPNRIHDGINYQNHQVNKERYQTFGNMRNNYQGGRLRGSLFRRRNYSEVINNPPHAIRVPVPMSRENNGERFEWMLVRK